jgi:uncharacterized protein (TIGR00251 family)
VVLAVPWITPSENGVCLQIKVIPRSSQNEVTGLCGDQLKIKLTAPPVDGQANWKLKIFLGGWLGCGTGRVSIRQGLSGRVKLVEITGVTQSQVIALVEKKQQ